MRVNTNTSELQSRSSRRRTRTLRNTFNYDNNNELSDIYSNYCDVTARVDSHQYQTPAILEEEPKIQFNQEYHKITEEQQKNAIGNSTRQISAAKDQLIKKLEINNKNITKQVQKIWEQINQIPQVKETPKKHRKLVQKQTNFQKLQKDLANAYKCIKIAEKQIEMYHKKHHNSGQFIQKLKKLKKDLNERQVISNRIKNQIVVRTKQLKQGEKLRVQLDNKIEVNQLKTLSEQFNHLLEVTKETEKRQQERVNVLKKQYVNVKKMQRQLIQKGISEFQLEQIKKKCMRQFPTKRQLQERKKDYQIKSQQHHFAQKEQKREQFTRKKLDEMINEINILQRKQIQFNKQYQTIKTVRNNYSQLNKCIEQKIKNCQREYQELENLNQKLRSKHIQQHRLRKIQTIKQQQPISNMRKSLAMKQKQELSNQKKIRFKSLPNTLNTQINKKQLAIKKRNCSFGKGSQGCNKFNDKYILDNQNKGKRIVGIIVYFQSVNSFITGISVTYEEGLKGGDYVWRVSDSQLQYKSQSYECGQGYIKDIIPSFIPQKEKFRLVGLELILHTGGRKCFGSNSEQKTTLNQREYVSCTYGSMSIININSKQISVIQELGFQIYQ